MPITGALNTIREASRRRRFYSPALLGAALPLFTVLAAVNPAAAGDLALHADLGIGGKYRIGSWIPITVSVLNSSNQTYHGQVQALADPLGPQGQQAPTGQPTEVFAVPATIPPTQGAPQTFTIYAHDIDPLRDNFTVQFAEGEQGDGRIAAKISVAINYKVRPLSGSPIPQGSIFIVGVGADPIGAAFLSGQHLGLRHTHGGIQPELKPNPHASLPAYPGAPFNGTPISHTVQAVAASPGSLPDQAVGYRGVDVVLLSADTSLDSLSDAQIQALQQWTLSGGRLVVCAAAGTASENVVPAGLQQILPARFAGAGVPITLPAGQTTATRMIPSNASGVSILQSAPDGSPLMLSRRYGGGSVLMLAYDPTSGPFRSWSGAPEQQFWRQIVMGPTSLLSYAMQYDERGYSSYNGDNHPGISAVVLHVPQLSAPGVWTVAIFLGVYILILVPINYLILKKLDRREWAWVTIPSLVVLVSVGAYGVGYAAKGGSLFVNRASILETSAGVSSAAAYAGCGLFSSHRASYDIDLSNPTAMAANPGTTLNPYRPWSEQDGLNFGSVHYVSTSSGAALRDAGVNMWSMRTFNVQSSVDLGGVIDGALKHDRNSDECVGSVVNHTPYALNHCAIYWHGHWVSLKTLAPGASAAVATDVRLPSELDIVTNTQYMSAPGDKNDAPAKTTSGMKRALAQLAASTMRGDNSNINYYNPDEEAVRTPLALGSDEAVFLGWSADSHLPGPRLKVDGQTAPQNDVTLVVVHIPVR